MACGCNKGKGSQNRSPSKLVAPRITVPSSAPIQQSIPNQGMVNLPPPPRMDEAAMRRIKQLNKDAVRRMFGK